MLNQLTTQSLSKKCILDNKPKTCHISQIQVFIKNTFADPFFSGAELSINFYLLSLAVFAT